MLHGSPRFAVAWPWASTGPPGSLRPGRTCTPGPLRGPLNRARNRRDLPSDLGLVCRYYTGAALVRTFACARRCRGHAHGIGTAVRHVQWPVLISRAQQGRRSYFMVLALQIRTAGAAGRCRAYEYAHTRRQLRPKLNTASQCAAWSFSTATHCLFPLLLKFHC